MMVVAAFGHGFVEIARVFAIVETDAPDLGGISVERAEGRVLDRDCGCVFDLRSVGGAPGLQVVESFGSDEFQHRRGEVQPHEVVDPGERNKACSRAQSGLFLTIQVDRCEFHRRSFLECGLSKASRKGEWGYLARSVPVKMG